MAFADVGLDLQTLFCTFLRPSDILTLRRTCKTLQFVTRQRTIWIDAVRRVCLENTLFLPSFPILDMSDVELEQAATAPWRWIELSSSSAAQEISDSKVRLFPTTSRIIDNPFGQATRLVLIPGGRYLVGLSSTGLGVWDLGYISSADCKLIASVGPEGGSFSGDVRATPDGMGLAIFLLRPDGRCSVYEIYPQNETPQLTKVACLDLPRYNLASYVSPDKMIWFRPHDLHGVTFIVWDYRLNASVSFLALVDVRCKCKVLVTQTAIVMLSEKSICIWAIPPLLPQPPNFDDYGLTRLLAPGIRINFPDRSLALYHSLSRWSVMSGWYFDPSKPLYFDKVVHSWPSPQQYQRFKLIIKPDLSDATLHFINIIQCTTSDIDPETTFQPMFCEDNMVYNWSSYDQCRIYTGSTLLQPTLHWNPSITNISLGVDNLRGLRICPASGRFVILDDSGQDTDDIVAFDFLPHQRLS